MISFFFLNKTCMCSSWRDCLQPVTAQAAVIKCGTKSQNLPVRCCIISPSNLHRDVSNISFDICKLKWVCFNSHSRLQCSFWANTAIQLIVVHLCELCTVLLLCVYLPRLMALLINLKWNTYQLSPWGMKCHCVLSSQHKLFVVYFILFFLHGLYSIFDITKEFWTILKYF